MNKNKKTVQFLRYRYLFAEIWAGILTSKSNLCEGVLQREKNIRAEYWMRLDFKFLMQFDGLCAINFIVVDFSSSLRAVSNKEIYTHTGRRIIACRLDRKYLPTYLNNTYTHTFACKKQAKFNPTLGLQLQPKTCKTLKTVLLRRIMNGAAENVVNILQSAVEPASLALLSAKNEFAFYLIVFLTNTLVVAFLLQNFQQQRFKRKQNYFSDER
uniref:Uncharacterized protein n=1 Tax=Glossina austeni TaxID=7395 RepID=A0A1A9VUB4_GLOAU